MEARSTQVRSARLRTCSAGGIGGVALAAVLLATGPAHANREAKVSLVNGGQENPPVATPARGCGRYSIDTENNTLNYHIAYCGLLGNVTAAHFHRAPIGANGGVVETLAAANPIVGTWNYPEGMEADILAGNIYVNVHSTMFPGGEIRGQLVDMVAIINGAHENPPTGSSATGYGLFNLDTRNDTLDYDITLSALDGNESAAHIHGFALHTGNAGVIHSLPAGSHKVGTFNYAANQEDRILNGAIYVNVHSDIDPSGEIRGQVTRMVEPLDGRQEVPANKSGGCGCGLLAHDKGSATLSYYLEYGNLSGPSTAAHIHGFAPPGQNAGVQHSIGTANPAKGDWNFGADDRDRVLDGLTYFNVHTAAFPGGEVRGQLIFPDKPCPTDANCDGSTGFDDLLLVLSEWGPYADCPPYKPADINQDCDVAFNDLLLVLSAWGPCPR